MKSTLGHTKDKATISIEFSDVEPMHHDEILRQFNRFERYLERYGAILQRLDAEEEPEESRGRAAMACVLRAQAMLELALNNLALAEDALSGARTATEAGFPEFDLPILAP